MVDSILAVIVLILAGWAIAKNYDAKVVLFIAALVLLYSGLLLGHNVLGAKASTGLSWVDPFKVIKDQFVRQYGNAGLIILTLFGFAAYMSHIGANDMVIKVLTKPLSYVRKPIILIPMVFWVGTCLQIIIPSAASLAVILMATLFPVLRAAGMSTLTAAALIATTATIVPTPLGGDNVVAARVLGFDNVVDYVAFHLAPITIPALFVMGIVHYFWQTYLDKKDAGMLKELDKEAMLAYVQKSGGQIIANKGATFYAVSKAVCKLCGIVLASSDSVATVSSMMHGEYGIEDVCLSTLTLVGPNGIQGKVPMRMNQKEIEQLKKSADALKEVIAQINLD